MQKLIKICGIRTIAEARLAAEAGADMIGLVFVQGSKRRVGADLAAACHAELGSAIAIAGVFQDQPLDEIRAVLAAAPLDLVQLHGGEDPDYCAAVEAPVLKRLRPADLARRPVFTGCRILVDPGSGDGVGIDWQALGPFPDEIVAGGLDPNNVADVIKLVKPAGVDVSSGVERLGGGKDPDRMLRFVRAARAGWRAVTEAEPRSAATAMRAQAARDAR
jgi:phosphoribosylanthranilate isomerase